MKTIFIIAFFMGTLSVSAQYGSQYLQLGDVQDSWSEEASSIDSATIEIKRKGAFAEVGMIFDFSARGTSFDPSDSLELSMFFDIPDNYEVSDMWLWINDSIVKAAVLDKWTAAQIYEDIVDRRVDPAILYKTEYYDWWSGYYYSGYLFRIFPLMTDMPRKAKITFLVPIDGTQEYADLINLPVHLLSLSDLPLFKTNLKVFVDTPLDTPKVVGQEAVFTYNSDVPGEEYFGSDLTGLSFSQGLDLSFKATRSDIHIGVYADTETGNKYYQMKLVPSEIFNLASPSKALFLLDFVQQNCSGLTPDDVLQGLKNHILSYANELDSINVMFSGMFTNVVSPVWLPADSASVISLFSSLDSSMINNFSNPQLLLMDGVSFMNNHPGGGDIVLISGGNTITGHSQANALMNTVFAAMDTVIKIHVVDLDNIDVWSEYYSYGGNSYYGNEYLNLNLAQLSGGEYYQLSFLSYPTMLSNISRTFSQEFVGFNCYTTLDNGFTFSNYIISNNTAISYIDEPISMVGRYTGTGDFNIVFSGQLENGQYVQLDTIVLESEIAQYDSITQSIWAGQYIRDLYTYTQSNSLIQQIIQISRDERVLSDYTAFLALEPGVGPLLDEEGNIITATEEYQTEQQDSMLVMNIYPNPANDYCNLSIELSKDEKVVVEMLDLSGKRVALLLSGVYPSGVSQVSLNVADYPVGTYIISVTTESCRLVKKLVLMR